MTDEVKPVVKHPGLKPWVKGQSGNPKGRTPMPPHLRRAKRMNKVDFQELLQKYVTYSKAQLIELAENDELPAMDLIVTRVLLEAIIHGDEKRLGFILDRLIGKLPSHIDLSGSIETTKKVDLSLLSTEELENMEKLLIKC